MDKVDRLQQKDIDSIREKNLEQDLRLERIARLTDKLERLVYVLIIISVLIASAFVFLRSYSIRVDFVEAHVK